MNNGNVNKNGLNDLYNTSYDPNNDPTRDFTAGSPNDNAFKVLMGSTNDIRDQKPNPTEALIEDYIGQNSKKILNNKYNISAFIFNAFYLFYRKLFGIGILLSIVIAILAYYTNEYIITLIISLICCFGFNPLYIMHVKKRVKIIQNEHPYATYEQLKSICENEGGTSGNLVIKGLFTNIIIGILVVILLITLGIGTTWKKIFNDFDFSEIFSIFKEEPDKKEFDGNYDTDDNVDFSKYFTFSIPTNYKKESKNNNTYNNKDFNCKISLKVVKEYKAAGIFINSMQKYYRNLYVDDESNPVTPVQIKSYNKVNWQGYRNNDDNGTSYYYVTDYKNKIFLVILNNINKNSSCDEDIYKLLQTFKEK